MCKYFDVCELGIIEMNRKPLNFGHKGLKFSDFGDPSLSTGPIAKIKNTTERGVPSISSAPGYS